MNTLSRLYLVVLILLGLLQLKNAHASPYEIQLFREYVAAYDQANAQYQSAPSGSYQEQAADQQRRQQAQYAQNIIRSPNAFIGLGVQENENLFIEFNSNYQSASSGSLRETIFDVARRAAGEGLKANALADLQATYDYKEALQKALTANSKYQSASSGSILENVYDQVRRQGFEISKQKLRDYVQNQLVDFRQSESLFLYLSQQYQSASSGSLIENYYDEGRRLTQSRTLDLFRMQANSMMMNQLASIEAEYNRKYQSASSGSLAEVLYRSIRDEAHARLQSVPPIPQPPIPQPPVPGPSRCQVMQGANASGQILYRVMDQAGRILATVLSYGEAVQIAQNDLRCR
jgi:hypothetical protein